MGDSIYTIVENNVSNYHIVTSKYADEAVRHAADELHKFLYKCTGACVPVFSDVCPRRGAEIKIGLNVRDDPYYSTLDYDEIGTEGFVIQTYNGDLYITGVSSRGTLYGVYSFLEKFCGIRWFSSEVTRIPQIKTLQVGPVTIMEKPAFEYRDAYWRDAFDGNFCVRNKMNSSKADISENMGGKMKFFNFHHSFNDLVPKEVYFKEHPEYFSEINGTRVYENTQLCLSNPEVFEISLKKVKDWIRKNPLCTVFSVAQNDCHNPCTCEACRKIDEKEGGYSGSIITFINKIAEALEEEYPNVLLHTFAYQYSIKPPKHIKPHRNVIVRLCSISCSFSQPFEAEASEDESGETAKFVSYLNDWSKICSRLYVWDYTTNFKHYLLPFPNLNSMQENIKLFYRLGVKGVFEQGNFSHGGGGYMAEMQAYLQAKLMWNPNIDFDSTLNEFLCGYFGRGALYIRRFLDMLQSYSKGKKVHIYDNTNAPYLTGEFINQANELFYQAEEASENDDVKRRIEKAHLSITFLKLAQLPMDTENRDLLIDNFAQKLRNFQISEIMERNYLESSISMMKKSQNFSDVSDRYSLYYRM